MSKPHIFFETINHNEDIRIWRYGNSNLTAEEMETVKSWLPSNSKVIQINFEKPETCKKIMEELNSKTFN